MGKAHNILNAHLREILEELLYFVGNEEAFTLTELEGFLFGLAITPEIIPPGEWIPVIFAEEKPDVINEEYIEKLIDAYNAYCNAFHKGKLKVPFSNLKESDFSEEVFDEMCEWSYGFITALSLRPKIWYLDYLEEHVPDDVYEIQLSYVVAYSMVFPEETTGLFRSEDGHPCDEKTFTAIQFVSLPLAVDTLKKYGEMLWKKNYKNISKCNFDYKQGKRKIGRNELCPCGSMKKYKKCCGVN
ncbi:MAG: UPF0149 family protein [Proteobacteria bacterium]|nr:UPF0149 family protein [Pseudomonadota bacterium]